MLTAPTELAAARRRHAAVAEELIIMITISVSYAQAEGGGRLFHHFPFSCEAFNHGQEYRFRADTIENA